MLRLLTYFFRANFQSKCKASHLQKAGNVTLHLYPRSPSRRTWHSLEWGDLMDAGLLMLLASSASSIGFGNVRVFYFIIPYFFGGIFQFSLAPGVNQEPPQGGVQIFPCMTHILCPWFTDPVTNHEPFLSCCQSQHIFPVKPRSFQSLS